MNISLKAGDKIYINGAVLRTDRKVTIELLNNVTFLLSSHVLQVDQASTPLRQLYFVVQTILMDPGSADTVQDMMNDMFRSLFRSFKDRDIIFGLLAIQERILAGYPFEALKTLRGLFPLEDMIIAGRAQNLSCNVAA